MNEYHSLKNKITKEIFYEILKNANKFKLKFSIETDIVNFKLNEIKHEDLVLYEQFNKISLENDIYKIVGFIVLEDIKINKIEISDDFNTLIFYEYMLWFYGGYNQLKISMERLGLNHEQWLDKIIKGDKK